MKRKLLISAVLILSIVLGLGLGVFAFSADNLENSRRDYERREYTAENGLSTAEDSLVILDAVDTYVHNVRIDAELGEVVEITVFYTESTNEGFSNQRSFVTQIEKKNGDYYATIDKSVARLRLDVYPEPEGEISLFALEINPRKLNFNTLAIFTLTLLPFLIGYSVIETLFDKKSFAKDILAMKRYKYLLYDLVTKDIKTKYRRSVLGILWSVLNPLLMMLVLTAVFSNIIRVEVEGGFALFYLTGYIIFNFISESTSFALYTITNAAPLIKKVYIPKYVFPLEKCIFSFVNMLFSLTAFVIVFVFFCITGKVTPSLSMLLFPIPMIYVFLFSLGLCFILATLMVFFRDIGHIWGILLTVWMYGSPIIYPVELVPDWLGSIIRLNPLYHYIDYFRSVMIYGRVPGLLENGICLLYSLAFFAIGVVIFRKSQNKFVLHV